jgi:class I fructose-bisphosphate aldolase
MIKEGKDHLTLDTYLTSSIPRSTSMGEEHRILSSVEHAMALGADAVKVFLIGGQNSLPGFADNVEKVAQVGNACFRWGIPLIIEPTLWGERVTNEMKHNCELIGHMCRIAYECGATVLKIPYPGAEKLKIISKNLACPILIMGGSNIRSESEMLTLVQEVMTSGAQELYLGRIWQPKR